MIVWHVTAHGYGHAVRSAAVINLLPEKIPVLVRSLVPRAFLEQEIRRSFRHEAIGFDCGVHQVDAVTIDVERTLAEYSSLQERNRARRAEQVDLLKGLQARVVVGDVPSFPFALAREAGIPSFAIANFNWHDVYARYVADRPAYRSMLDAMRDEYDRADLCLRLPFSTEMPAFPRQERIGLVCRASKRRREEMARRLDLDPSARWALVYVGGGSERFDWKRLERMRGTRFLVLGDRPPAGTSSIVAVDPSQFGGQDVAATVDIVLAKPGYGIAADCVGNGTPLVFTERADFVEAEVLLPALERWGRGIRVPLETFLAGDLTEAFERAMASRAKEAVAADGARSAAEVLVRAWHGRK